MDISSNGSYPANKLSNFAGHRFMIDGIECYSMEGFIQGLKFRSADMQVEICKLVGIGAKRAGANKDWKRLQTLYWRGHEIKRNSLEYQELLDKAYTAMFEQSESFRNDLKASKGSTLTHRLGKRKQSDTVLTTNEFISRLNKLRDKII